MAQMHFDYTSGLTIYKNNKLIPIFPTTVTYMTHNEWDDVRNPNVRSQSTYWKQNSEVIQNQVVTFDEIIGVAPGIKKHATGEYSRGHDLR